MVEAAGQWFRIFQCGLDYAFIPLRDAGRIIRYRKLLLHFLPTRHPWRYARILVRAHSFMASNQRAYESLQGREGWPFATPRRCQGVSTENCSCIFCLHAIHGVIRATVRVHRMSPVFTLLLREEATIVLIEPASANSRPLGLHA